MNFALPLRQVPFLGAVSVFLLSACASGPTPPNPGLKESFHTEVAANGAKRFTYALERSAPVVRGPYTEGGEGRNRMRNQDMQRRPQRSMGAREQLNFDYAMKLKLQESGFCRDGYFEIERSLSAMGGEVRGECRDGAR